MFESKKGEGLIWVIVFVIVDGVVEEDDEVEAKDEEGVDAMEAKLWYHERKAKK